jgi:hypothetical protein
MYRCGLRSLQLHGPRRTSSSTSWCSRIRPTGEVGEGAESRQLDDVLDVGLPCMLEDALVLSDSLGTVPAREEQDVDADECAGERGIVLEAALHGLRTLRTDRPRHVTDQRSDFCSATDEVCDGFAPNLAGCCGDQDHRRRRKHLRAQSCLRASTSLERLSTMYEDPRTAWIPRLPKRPP